MKENTRIFLRIVPVFLALILFLSSFSLAANRTLVLFPLAFYAEHPKSYLRQGLTAMLLSRLSGGGLDVLTGKSISPLLVDKERDGIITRQRVEMVARKLGADFALFGSVTSLGGGYSLDLSLLDMTKTPPKLSHVSEATSKDDFIPRLSDAVNSIRAIMEGRYGLPRREFIRARRGTETKPPRGIFSPLGQAETGIGPGEEESFFRPTRQKRSVEATGRIALHFSVMSFDAGDMTGDDRIELAVLGRDQLRIYVKKDKIYRLRDTLKASMGEEFFKVSVADVDGNGRSEIYLVSFYGMRARTSVFEWNGKFRLLYRRTGHLRAVRDPQGHKPRLLFQDSKVGEFFSGRISLLEYDAAGKPKESKRLPRLKEVHFYSLSLYDLSKDGKPEIIGLGQGNSLHVWNSDGDVLWAEDKSIGGTNNTLLIGDTNPAKRPHWIPLEARLVIADINGDGKKELVAVKNTPMIQHIANLIYIKSNLIAYRIDGATLTRGWDTIQIPYCITDIQVRGNTLFLAAQKGKIGKIGKNVSRIMWFVI